MDPARREEILDRMIEINTSSWTQIPIAECPKFFITSPRVEACYRLPFFGPNYFFPEWKYTGVEK
jgi:hypothetical protein